MTDSGIYIITCVPTGDFYVGSTVNFKTRKASHWSEMRNGLKPKRWDWLVREYGLDSFTFHVYKRAPKVFLIKEEDEAIQTLRPTLNLSSEASFRPYQYGSKNPASKHSEEEILTLFRTIASRPWQSLAQIDRDLGFCKGTSQKVRSGVRYTHIKKVEPELYDLVVSGKYQTLTVQHDTNGVLELSGSITEISKQLGVSDSHLFDVFYGRAPHAKGWRIISKSPRVENPFKRFPLVN